MIRLFCGPKNSKPTGTFDFEFELYGRASDPNLGSIGGTIPRLIKHHKLNPTPVAWDFLSIALSVIAVDDTVSRASSPDGWTRQIALTISVTNTSLWDSRTADLEKILCFLTGDIWKLRFVDRGFQQVAPPGHTTLPNDCVCLLSGGMDSLIGAIDLVAQGKKPAFVSQVSKGDKSDQKKFAQMIAKDALHFQVNHNRLTTVNAETSQRSRSIIFVAFEALVASCMNAISLASPGKLYVPENGYISLNIPLTPLRFGSLSTRTTHPHYINLMNALFKDVGLCVSVENPYQFKTKGEMLTECHNQGLLKTLIPASTSCGRYARTGFKQCGRCVPCLVRRAAFNKWGNDPSPGYKFSDLSINDQRHKNFDDVRSVAFAIRFVRSHGLEKWIGGSLNSAQLGDLTPYKKVIKKGLDELEQFLKVQGAI